jgi:hypothetical protein
LYDVSFDEDQIESTHLTQLSDAGYTNLAPLREPPAWPQTQTTHPSVQREIAPPLPQQNHAPQEAWATPAYEPHLNTNELAEEDLHAARNELLFQPVQPRPNGNTQVTDLPPEKAYALMQANVPPARSSIPVSASQSHPSRVAHPYTTPPPSAYPSAGYGRSESAPPVVEVGYLPSPAGQDIVHLMGQPTQLSASPHTSSPVGSIPVKRGQRQSLDEMGMFALEHTETTAVRTRQEAQTHRPEATIARFDREPALDPYAYPSSAALPTVSPPPLPPDAKRTSSPPPIPPDAKRASSPPPPPPAALRSKNAKHSEKPVIPAPREAIVPISFAPEPQKESQKPPSPKVSRPAIPKPSVPPPPTTPSQANMNAHRPPSSSKALSIPHDPFAPDDATLIRTQRPKK